MTRRFWTPAEVELLRRAYADHTTEALATTFNRTVGQVHQKANKLGLKKSAAYLARIAANSGLAEAGRATRRQPGQAPWNKGKPGSTGTHPNSRKTQFRRGERRGIAVEMYQPIGTERISKDGYLEIKTNDDMPLQGRWQAVHRIVWEAAHGQIPAKHVVRFLPGQHTTVRAEITADRLECISMVENMRRNTVHRYPKEIARAVQLMGALNRRINNVEKQNNR